MKKAISICQKIYPWIILAFSYTLSVSFLILKGRSSLDSDMASEMILADMLNQEGRMISDNWYASTGFPIFTVHPFLQLGLKLFPNDWNMARTLGMAIMLALLAGAYFLLAHAMDTSLSRKIIFSSAILCPFGFWYMNLVTFGGYYLPALIIMMIGAALVILPISKTEAFKKNIIVFILAVLVAFCGGLKDIRCLMNLYVPLIVAALVLLVYKIHREPDSLLKLKCQEWKLFLIAVASFASNVAGYLLNTLVIAKKYSFQGMTEQTWSKMSIEALLNVWSKFFSLFGYQSDDFTNSLAGNQTNPQLFSLQGIIGAIGIATALMIVFSSIRLLKRWNYLNFQQQILVTLFWSIFIINGIIFGWTEGYESNVTYWAPLIPFAILTVEIEIATEHFSIPAMREIAVIGFICCIFCTSYATIREYQTEPMRANPNFINISNWLVENGYTEGYASFWNSNVLTVLSNGKLEIWTVYNMNDRAVQPWLQKKNHMEQPPEAEKVFAIIGPEDEITEEGAAYADYQQAQIVFTDEYGFSVLELSK